MALQGAMATTQDRHQGVHVRWHPAALRLWALQKRNPFLFCAVEERGRGAGVPDAAWLAIHQTGLFTCSRTSDGWEHRRPGSSLEKGTNAWPRFLHPGRSSWDSSLRARSIGVDRLPHGWAV